MPLEDGTNAEKEDPEPPLGWTSKDDIKDCKVYGQLFSPPCFKIMLFLKHYGIPFELVSADAGKGITKESSYKKIPVMTASGRTINDSSVIVHQLLAACGGDAFDKERQEEITFGLQPAIEVDVLACAADFKKIALKAGFPVWCVPEFVLGGLMGEKISESIKAKNPDMKPSLDYGKAFKAGRKVGHATLRMCGPPDGDLMIDILPFRMVIGTFSRQSNPADKSKCRIKSGKLKAFAQPRLITIGADDPSVQLFDRNSNFRFA